MDAPRLPRIKVGAVSPNLQAIFNEMTGRRIRVRDMAEKIGRTANTVSSWRVGDTIPTINDVEDMAYCLGYRLMLIPIRKE
ncbi:hypothetical protein DEA98_10530 [Brucella pseudogrignonensis]|uniref:Uncharacterized protein n=1 Tax=Brucella pseudogrignonensis TaxID=419475 RepID=A0A7Y3WY86_9HYPH|nr:hypothetical protein [Brucella pseudogrignonensis]KAB2699400.1 hypothetical protein F9K79_09920 [Ochrobactrum sp. Kaboul]MCM0751594.1 hypothetical protein [Brucella pseudogrignonensis]MCM0751626.1 hypothetical protein [Brucella pseudogrignonensis]NNV22016.1 hypothetical protein [Brucella pseudogrignonensis]